MAEAAAGVFHFIGTTQEMSLQRHILRYLHFRDFPAAAAVCRSFGSILPGLFPIQFFAHFGARVASSFVADDLPLDAANFRKLLSVQRAAQRGDSLNVLGRWWVLFFFNFIAQKGCECDER